MNDRHRLTRRAYLRRHLAVVGGALVGGPAALLGCSKEGGGALRCTDTTGLSPEDVLKREQLVYVDLSPKSDENCLNCNFWIPEPAEGQCGGCDLFAGPAHPLGYCTSWAPVEDEAGAGAGAGAS